MLYAVHFSNIASFSSFKKFYLYGVLQRIIYCKVIYNLFLHSIGMLYTLVQLHGFKEYKVCNFFFLNNTNYKFKLNR